LKINFQKYKNKKGSSGTNQSHQQQHTRQLTGGRSIPFEKGKPLGFP
jgi:hypothetical protein